VKKLHRKAETVQSTAPVRVQSTAPALNRHINHQEERVKHKASYSRQVLPFDNKDRIAVSDDRTDYGGKEALNATDLRMKFEQREEREQRRVKQPDPRVKEFITFWFTEYQKRFSDPYLINVKDAAQTKRLLGTHSVERLKELALQFLASKDPWVQTNGGFTIGVFASQINKLISTHRSQTNMGLDGGYY
jgi:hypothetical protein